MCKKLNFMFGFLAGNYKKNWSYILSRIRCVKENANFDISNVNIKKSI